MAEQPDNDASPGVIHVVARHSERQITETDNVTGGQLIKSAGRTVLSALWHTIRYEPIAVRPPTVDTDFGTASLAERTIETLRYNLWLLDHAIEPNGWLRAWVIMFIKLLLFVAVPLIAVAVVTWLCVPIATGVQSVSVALAHIFENLEAAFRHLFFALLWLLVSLAVLALLWVIIATVVSKK